MNENNILDKHLNVLTEMKEVGIDGFFYTRLKVNMEQKKRENKIDLPIKPFWVVSVLSVFLLMNFYMLFQSQPSYESATDLNSLEAFASSYDQQITSDLN